MLFKSCKFCSLLLLVFAVSFAFARIKNQSNEFHLCRNVLTAPAAKSNVGNGGEDGLVVSWNTIIHLHDSGNVSHRSHASKTWAGVQWGYKDQELTFQSDATSFLSPDFNDKNSTVVTIIHNTTLPFQGQTQIYFRLLYDHFNTSTTGDEKIHLDTAPCQKIFQATNLLSTTCPRLSMFGDLGWSNNQIYHLTRAQLDQGDLDAIVLFGDMVYYWGQETSDTNVTHHRQNTLWFMQNLSDMTTGTGTRLTSKTVTTRIAPLLVSPGNGEAYNSFSDYHNRFFMPCNPGQERFCRNHWYSINVGGSESNSNRNGATGGGMHLIALSSELLGYWPSLPPEMKVRMMQWLVQDLRKATSPTMRRLYPWIVVHYHRPSYSSWGDPEKDSKPFDAFEEVFHKYQVDAVFAGHVHNMELTTPVSFNQSDYSAVHNASYIYNASKPVYVVAGNPSNYESTSYFEDSREWTLWRSYMFGHATLSVGPATKTDEILTIEFVHSATRQIAHRVTLAKPRKQDDFKEDSDDLAVPQPNTDKRTTNVKTDVSCLRNQRLRELPVGTIVISDNEIHGGLDIQSSSVPWEQVAALRQIYDTLGGPSWLHSKGWVGADSITDSNNACGWYGVTCQPIVDQMLPDAGSGANYGITALLLASNNLSGDISHLEDAFRALGTSLQIIDLSSNFIYGKLFNLEKALPRVHTVALSPWSSSATSISGHLSLPRNTRYAFLERTQLSGTLPNVVGHLPCFSGGSLFNRVGCLLWLMNSKNVTGSVPLSVCSKRYNEIFLNGTNISGGPCLRNITSYFEQPYSNCTNCARQNDTATLLVEGEEEAPS